MHASDAAATEDSQLAGVMSGLYTVMPPGIYGSILVVSSSTAHMLGSPHIGAAALQSAS